MSEDVEYCDAIYRRFVERRGHSLVLPVRDWEQILTWREREVPLGVVLHVIDRHVERSDGQGHPLRLTELGPLVRAAWLDTLKAGVGRPTETDAEPETFTATFALSQIVEPAAERLRQALPDDPAGKATKEALHRAIGRLRRKSLTGVTAEQLLKWESRVNKALLDAAQEAAPPEVISAAEAIANEAAAAAPPRGAEILRRKLAQLVLRKRLGVPRLRLFGAV